ncbi:MAG TPA: glycosyltransferase family 4 protein [Chloroflexota bacterium]|nr:glycosyltransferase family 4 protein [Chloroflexota bacterium]
MQAPYISGGAEVLADSLQSRLRGRGHSVEVVRIPFKWYPPDAILRHMLACRLIDLPRDRIDLAICLKFPAYMVPFPNKKLWLLHQFRQVYELWGSPFQELPDTPEGARVRDAIIGADNQFLREATAIYTNSQIVARRLKTYNGIDATEVLYPPLPNAELFSCVEYGDFFFYPSRITSTKRQELAIEAMRLVKSDFKLVLAGNPDAEAYGRDLKERIQRYGLQDRIKWLGWITDDEKAHLMARAFAALYLPYDEDSYGYVTLEAFQSHKPVITLSDSGGTEELIEHGLNGLVADPTADSLAEHMESLWSAKSRTRELGENAFQSLSTRGIAWEHVLDRLIA